MLIWWHNAHNYENGDGWKSYSKLFIIALNFIQRTFADSVVGVTGVQANVCGAREARALRVRGGSQPGAR